jgi:hypothetical protein
VNNIRRHRIKQKTIKTVDVLVNIQREQQKFRDDMKNYIEQQSKINVLISESIKEQMELNKKLDRQYESIIGIAQDIKECRKKQNYLIEDVKVLYGHINKSIKEKVTEV